MITTRPFGRVPPPPAGGTWYQELNAAWDRVEKGLPRSESKKVRTQADALRDLIKHQEGLIKLHEQMVQTETGKDREQWEKRLGEYRESLPKRREELRLLEEEEKTAPPPRKVAP